MKSDAAKRIMLAQSLASIKGVQSAEAQQVRDAAMQEILLTLWDTDELKRLIETEHQSHCGKCEVRKWVENAQREEEFLAKERKRKGAVDDWKELSWKLLKIIAFVIVSVLAILGHIHGVNVKDVAAPASAVGN